MQSMNKKTYLVTGGAGFVGSHLCKRLLDENHAVICLDNFFTGRKQNINTLMSHPDFELIRHDITQPISVEVDGIFNLACPASPVHYQWDPIQTTKISMFGILNMLDLALRLKCPILQASTSEVYGDPQVHPQTEDYWGHVHCNGIRSCYDEGKRIAESLMMDYHRQHDVDIRIARIFNTYGPNMNPEDGRVVSNFIVQALQGNSITLYGDGLQTRSFCYVDDLVDGFMKLMFTPRIYVPVNLGNPSERTVRDLAEQILAQIKSNSDITYKPLPQDDPMQRCPDITRAKSLLGWEPKVSLEEGLKKTIAYFKHELSPSTQKAA